MKWLVVVLALLAFPVGAEPVAVTDGDTIKLGGTAYRLWGIDAPEIKQDCTDGWPAGRESLSLLQNLTRNREVICAKKTTDRYGRTVAICRADGVDLSAAMVSAGMALAFVRYSSDYVKEEAAARAAKRGLHTHDCVAAWEWRAKQRSGYEAK